MITARHWALVVIFALAGCASEQERRQAEGSFDYLTTVPGKTLQLPEGMKGPATGERYTIPPAHSRGAIGQAVDVLPPPQLLAVAEGSSVVDGIDRYAVRFDAIEQSGDMRDLAWYTLWEFFADAGLKGRFWDRDQGVVITDWHSIDYSEKQSIWSRLNPFIAEPTSDITRQRFLFQLDVASNGRSATLSASLLEFERLLNGKSQHALSPEQRRAYVVGVLNEAVAWYEYKQRLLTRSDGDGRQQIHLGFGQDASGMPLFVADAGFNRTWQSLATALERLGFAIDDHDKTKGSFSVSYEGSVSFWRSMFGAQDELPLKRTKYQIMVGELATQRTSITILDEDNRPLKQEVAAKVHPVLERALATPISEPPKED